MDIDAILPRNDLQSLEENDDFWSAQEHVNAVLGETGLYFTHLFEETQVILTPNWLEKCLPLAVPSLRHVHLWRPSTEDLILTKMMRIDPQDREDIHFLLRQPDAVPSQIRDALDHARIPPVPEIEQAFAQNRTWLLPHLAG